MKPYLLLSALLLICCSSLILGATTRCEYTNVGVVTTEVDSELVDVKWVGSASDASHKLIFATTKKSNLYRSVDEGQTWSNEKDKLVAVKAGQTPAGFGIKQIISTADSNKLYFVGYGADIWTTTDQGTTYNFYSYLSKLNQTIYTMFTPSPNNPNHAIARTASPSCFQSAPGRCYFSLYVTKDFGLTWSLITTYIRSAAWGPNGQIWFDYWAPKTGEQYASNLLDYTLAYTNDFGSTIQIYENGGVAGFVFRTDVLFWVKATDNTMQVWSSRNYGTEQHNLAQLPVSLAQTRYTILDTGDDFVFMNVEHGDTDWGNLYVSDETDQTFSLSLERNKRDAFGHCDFIRGGMKGIYLANWISDYIPGTNDPRLQTVVSYNNGGDWHALTPPQFDSLGKPVACVKCSLNLHGIHKNSDGAAETAPWGPLYTNPNAVGLIMATGNVGKFLSDQGEDANTYFSRDAGHSWIEVAKGSHVYEFGDHGAITVMANNMKDTNTLMYSPNEGLSWTTCQFIDNNITVVDILVEPNNTAQTFLLYGTRTVGGTAKGVIVYLDFSNYFQRVCNDSDYELWTPSDTDGRNCILGLTVQYQRRKQNSTCFNGRDFEPYSAVWKCACAQEDYECDYCYKPEDGQPDVCIPDCDESLMNQQPQNCDGYWNMSRGYRLVDNNQCDPTTGLDLRPIQVKCASHTPSPVDVFTDDKGTGASKAGLIVGILLVVGLVGCLVAVVVAARKNQRFREAIFSRLPERIRDPFRSVAFTRVDTSAPDDLENTSDHDEPQVLNDDDIINFTSQKDDSN